MGGSNPRHFGVRHFTGDPNPACRGLRGPARYIDQLNAASRGSLVVRNCTADCDADDRSALISPILKSMAAATHDNQLAREEQTPLLLQNNHRPSSPTPAAPQLGSATHPTSDDRPGYSLASLREAHSLPTHRTGLVWVAMVRSTTLPYSSESGFGSSLSGLPCSPIAAEYSLFTHFSNPSRSSASIKVSIIVLQPTDTPASKRTGLLVHEGFQLLGSLSILIGASAIFYNKILHSAPHFTSWHGLFGLISTCVILVQAFFGMLIGFETSRDYILGDSVGRKLWKFHRFAFLFRRHIIKFTLKRVIQRERKNLIFLLLLLVHRLSGYLLIFLMTITVLTVTKADWVIMVTTKWLIWVLTISPIVALIGLLSLAKLTPAKFLVDEDYTRR
ncbi:hypothetical protein VP01_473g10 [Puccinia sorghi]|uniref:Cytochrome b561 domain-containing protein n=1 Tax=Puccinia sorghi TaxID=27349 RepID=A0A0L6UMW7_9BASI|nr:hypothetical protein VP01_473g10 [Puccinia sorghi]